MIDQKALEAAYEVLLDNSDFNMFPGFEKAIEAYEAAKPQPDIKELWACISVLYDAACSYNRIMDAVGTTVPMLTMDSKTSPQTIAIARDKLSAFITGTDGE